MIGKVPIFVSLLLLQSRLKQFFRNCISCKKKSHGENILELKYWGSGFWGKPTLKIGLGIFYFIILWALCHYFNVILK